MFFKNSRYKKLFETALTNSDATGAALLRLSTVPSGTFQHTIAQTDRLDHIAYKYYKDPKKWWCVCDANQGEPNPDFKSPQAILGKDPMITMYIPVHVPKDEEPAWCDCMNRLYRLIGVDRVDITDCLHPVERELDEDGMKVIYFSEHCERAIQVTFNSMCCSLRKINHEIHASGFSTNEPVRIERTGKKIIIPPDGNG